MGLWMTQRNVAVNDRKSDKVLAKKINLLKNELSKYEPSLRKMFDVGAQYGAVE